MNNIKKAIGSSFCLLYKLTEIVICFLVALVMMAPAIGVIFTFFDWYWGGIAVSCTLISGVVLGICFYRSNLLRAENSTERFVLLIIFLVTMVLYVKYSPVLDIAQDPSLYMFRSLNLVNYGHDYKPMLTFNYFVDNGVINNVYNEYHDIQIGTWLEEVKLIPDFYPGASYFYALFGYFVKPFIFYGQTAIMIINSYLLYFAVKRVTGIKNNVVIGFYTLAFMVSPLIVWFGRGSFTEPVALLFFLLILNVLIQKSSPWLLLLCFLISYSARIDYFIIVIIGVFLLTYLNRNIGVLYSVFAVAEFFLYSKTYKYYERIVEDMPIIKYIIGIIIIVLIASLLIERFGREIIERIFYSKAIKYLLIAIGIGCVLLMFYNNIISAEKYNIALIHEQMLRTYEEEIVDLLFLVFPSIIIVGGFIGIHTFINKDNLDFLTSVFLVSFGVIYLYLLFGGMNSPMLYWLLRRYYNNIIPIALIAFCMLFRELKGLQAFVLGIGCFLLSLNMYLDSGQIVDYNGLDKSVIEMEKELKDNGYQTVYYDTQLKNAISPLFSYSDLEFVPISHFELGQLAERHDEFAIKDSIFLSNSYVEEKGDLSFELTYQKMGEEYGKVPKMVYDRNDKFEGYDLERMLPKVQRGNIYPFGEIEEITGLDSDSNWTSKIAEIKLKATDISDKKEIVLKTIKEYNSPWLENNEFEKLDLRILVNGIWEIKPSSYEDGCFYFPLDKFDKDLLSIKITCTTFNPSELGMNDDTRDLGIAIESIYLQ